MLKLTRLYTQPKVIEPIEFKDGLNLIMGEKDDSSDKRNGVGKSLCIEFINFALLKRKSDSRVAYIPSEVFSSDVYVCLDIEIHGEPYTIKRSIKESEEPTIYTQDREIEFSKIEDATQFLTEKLFSSTASDYPSFRGMIGPLIRDERSEFKSLISCYDTARRVADDYTPHLYLLDLEISLYKDIKKQIDTIDKISNDIKSIKENVKLIRQKDISDARSDLNELDDEVLSIEASIDRLENITGYEIIKDEMISIEEKIESFRREKTILKQQVAKLKPVSQKVEIDVSEVYEFYEQLKSGLGDLVSKDLQEVIGFKARIDEFQNQLINNKKHSLIEKIENINKKLNVLDKSYTEHLSVLDQKGGLKNLKQTYAAFQEKSDQLSELRSFVSRYDELESEKQKLKSEKELNLLKLQTEIQSKKANIDDFEKTILNIHDFIQGNKQASFQIKNTNTKQVIEINMRIDSDGSHSVNREKVFIYDMALLLNQFTRIRHPGFLIHDNIFDVDQDTLMKSITYLEDRANFGSSQYILTLNSDRLDSYGADIKDRLTPYIRARFTKLNRFLKTKYQETK